MSSWRSIVGLAAASWIALTALTAVAIAQSRDDLQLPTGDAWITPDHPYLFYLHPKEKTSTSGTALGDVWVVPDQDERSAQLKSERQEEGQKPDQVKKIAPRYSSLPIVADHHRPANEGRSGTRRR